MISTSRDALWPLIVVFVFVGLACGQEQFATVRGKVSWHSGVGDPAVYHARIEVLDEKDPRAKRVVSTVRGDNGGHYTIENLSVGSHELVACADIFLEYEPKRLSVNVKPDGPEVNFKLETMPILSGIELQPTANWNFMYFKNMDTGCESGPLRPNQGTFTIKNIDPEAFDQDYAYCLDTVKESDSDPAPFASCVKNKLKGKTKEQLRTDMGAPENVHRDKHDGSEIWTYRYAKVTLLKDKVSEITIGVYEKH